MRITVPVETVLCVMGATPTRRFYGLELIEATGFQSGTLYPVLARMETAGVLDSDWEDVDPSVAGRPARRYYELTPDGADLAAETRRMVAARARGRMREAPV